MEEDKQKSHTEEEEQPKNLYGKTYEGDCAISQVKEKAILIVGATRAGKSTSMLWYLAKALIGQKVGGKPTYICQSKQNAETDQSFLSKTLVPNVESLNKDVSLVDMAGFSDTRDYVGVVGVSYMLKAILEKVKQVKFILTIPGPTIISNSGKGLAKQFGDFVKMFQFAGLSDQIKQKILDSVCLLITSASQEEDYFTILNAATKQFEKKALKIENKKQINIVLKHILQEKKIVYFPKAVVGESAKQCDIDQKLKDKNWNFMNLQQCNNQFKKSIIKIPFDQDYQNLEQNDQKAFLNQKNQKLESFKLITQILANFINHASSKNHWYSPQISFNQCFVPIKSFLQKYDAYDNSPKLSLFRTKLAGMQITIDFEKKKEKKIYGVQLLQNLQKIYTKTVKTKPREDGTISYRQYLQYLWSETKQALKICKQTFCQTRQEEQNFLNFSFVIGRGFREFQMLVDIAQIHTSEAAMVFKESLNGIFTQPIYQLKAKFIFNQTDQIKQSLFKDQKQLTRYINFVSDFKHADNPSQQNRPRTQQQLIKIQQMKGVFLIRQKKYTEAIQSFTRANKSLQDFKEQFGLEDSNSNEYDQNQKDGEEEEEEKDQDQDNQEQKKPINIKHLIQNRQIILYKYIAECLEKMEKYKLALKFYIHIQFVESSIRCFNKVIDSEKDLLKKLKILIELAKYSSQHGKILTAIQAYQKGYEIAQNYHDREKIKSGIKKLKMDGDILLEQYFESIESIKTQNNQSLMEDLQQIIHPIQQ